MTWFVYVKEVVNKYDLNSYTYNIINNMSELLEQVQRQAQPETGVGEKKKSRSSSQLRPGLAVGPTK